MLMAALLVIEGCSSNSDDATKEASTVRRKIVVTTDQPTTSSEGLEPKQTDIPSDKKPAADTVTVTATAPATQETVQPTAPATPQEIPAPAPSEIKETIAAAPEPEKNGTGAAAKKKEFMIDKKIDPFISLFKADSPSVNQASKRVPQGPLEMIALDQLKLTGIVRKQHVAKALVEEASGKGYVIEVGTYVGSNGGRVTQILDDRVIVQEESTDALGKKTVQERELKLLRGEGKKSNEK